MKSCSSYGTLLLKNLMDINRMLSELREERENIEQAILVLERIAQGSGKRRGRPPKWMAAIETGEVADGTETAPKKRRFSSEARKRMAEAQRRRWAAAREGGSQE